MWSVLTTYKKIGCNTWSAEGKYYFLPDWPVSVKATLQLCSQFTDGYQLNTSSISDNILRQQQNTSEEKISSQQDKNFAELRILSWSALRNASIR